MRANASLGELRSQSRPNQSCPITQKKKKKKKKIIIIIIIIRIIRIPSSLCLSGLNFQAIGAIGTGLDTLSFK